MNSEADAAPLDLTPPPLVPAPTWGIRHIAFGVVGVLVLFFLISTVVILPATAQWGEDADETLFAAAFAQLTWYAASVVFIYAVVRRAGGSWAHLGIRPPSIAPNSIFAKVRRTLPLPYALVVPLTGWAMALGSVITYTVIATNLDSDILIPNQQLDTESYTNPFVLGMLGVAIVAGAPIAEEIMFRGFFFGGLRRRMTFLPAALISGSVFSLAHGDIGLIVPFTIVGAILAYSYEKTGTLYGSISVHFVFNLVTFIILLTVPEARD